MKTDTRFHNIDLVKKDLGYQQISNSTLFVKNGQYLLSPSVSGGEAGSFWIDIRQTNLDQIPDRTKCDFLIRIVPEMFCLCKLSAINKLLSPALMDNRPNSGYVWGIKLEIKKFKKTVEIRSNRDMMISVSVPLLDKSEVIRVLYRYKNTLKLIYLKNVVEYTTLKCNL